MLKRSLDLLVAVFCLVLFAPLLLGTGLLVFIKLGRPIFYFQDRPGYRGKIFRILKFRTMVQATDVIQTEASRVTLLGSFLRSTSLDELPELFNVVRGEMSLVGPRPLLVKYLSLYTPDEARRHEARPGITGWAQINGRNNLSWKEKFELDLWYVNHQSFFLDFKILIKTVLKTIRREGISAKGHVTMPEFTGSLPKIEMSGSEINDEDVASVVDVLRSGRLALGPKVKAFEEKIANYVGVKHAVAVSSGTAALHLIIKSLGIGPGDEVLVPSFTFAASVNAILYEGATPVFVDVDMQTYNLEIADLARKLTRKTRAIMAVDVFGHSVDWDGLTKFAQDHKLLVIDDSCEALGAEYKGQKLGSFGDAAAFAFYPNKQITTGEGGMIVTNNDDLARLCRSYRNQGRDEMGQWLEHARIGYNYRMDEMSGALGLSQMNRIEDILKAREDVAKKYDSLLKLIPEIILPQVLAGVKMSWFVYVIRFEKSIKAAEVIRGLEERGIPARAYFSPIHSQAYLQNINTPQKDQSLPHTQSISGQTLALPFHGKLSDFELNHICEALKSTIAAVKKIADLAA